MCGIFGLASNNGYDLEKSSKALNLLFHRGPDQFGEWYDDGVYLGHRRLSILDTSENGKQPMISKNIVIAVNGEIYNYKELKNELCRFYTFNSSSDSEVILHGYHKWGIQELIARIDGMYAITIYDIDKQKLYLVRDRVGIKPLYFGVFENQFIWGSELNSIVSYVGESNLEIDYTALYDFLTYLYIPTPKSMYKRIYKVEPANFIEVDLVKWKYESNQYWKLEVKNIDISLEQASKRLKELIEQSVSEQIVSDVPISFFLSGGMDSSVVVSVASKMFSNLEVNTIGFNDKEYDEVHYAALLAHMYKASHNVKILKSSDVANSMSKIKEWYVEPFADTSAFPTYLVSELTKERSTVALTGDGGDEVFGGYNWYSRFEKIKSFANIPVSTNLSYVYKIKKLFNNTTVQKILNRIELLGLRNDLELYAKLMGGLLKHEKEYYRAKWNIDSAYDDYWYYRKYYREDIEGLKRLQYLDFHTYLHDDILTKVDRVSMRVSLEARVPLLSKDIIEFMFSIPNGIIYNNGALKGLLKYAFKDNLPDEIINRKKQGFSVPYKKWRTSIWEDNLELKTNASRQEMILKELYSAII